MNEKYTGNNVVSVILNLAFSAILQYWPFDINESGKIVECVSEEFKD